MKRDTIIILAIVLTVFLSCNNTREFPKARKLSEYKKTEFLPTLEHKINIQKNNIYCVTLLYAWDEIRHNINQPLKISKEDYDLNLLNNSKSYIDVLKSNEYIANGGVDDDGLISVYAEFNKSLPFENKLQSYKNKLVFDGQAVASFGINGYDDDKQLEIVQIVYYKNDNNFIIKLLPKDKNHEIILFKSQKIFSSLIEMNEEIGRLTEIGKTEKIMKNKVGNII